MRLVLFDIDGTLVNTLGSGKAALGTALAEVYGDTGPIDTFDFYGKTDPAIVRELLAQAGWPDERIDAGLTAVWPVYCAELDQELAARDGQVHTYPGVTQLLAHLESDNRFAVGLVTGNLREGASRKLAAAGLTGRFRFGAFGSDSERREDLPPIARDRAVQAYGCEFDLREAVVVGDTPEDIRCARANGARVLAVATGRHSVAELREFEPDVALNNLADTSVVMRMLADE